MPDMIYISSGVTSTGLMIGSKVSMTLMEGAKLINTTLGYNCRLVINGGAVASNTMLASLLPVVAVLPADFVLP